MTFFSFFTKWKYRVATTNKIYFRFLSHCFSKVLVLFALTLLFQWFTDGLLTIKYERSDWFIQIYTFHYLFNDCSDFRPSLRLFLFVRKIYSRPYATLTAFITSYFPHSMPIFVRSWMPCHIWFYHLSLYAEIF